MSLPWLAQDAIAVLCGAPVSDYGDATAVDWSNPTVTAEIGGCSLQPVLGDEISEGRDAIVTRWNLFVPDPDAPITSLNRIRDMRTGIDYDIDGSPQVWRDPTPLNLSHMVMILRRTDG